MNLPADTLSDEIEPYLLREQFIIRTPRGRLATGRTYDLLEFARPKAPPTEPTLFDLT
jgi:Holliday junction DNA helicase RuvB